MSRRIIEGWLFDVDELGESIALWVYLSSGELLRLQDGFRYPCYVTGEREKLKQLSSTLSSRKLISSVRWQMRREFWSGTELETLELHVTDSSVLPRLRQACGAIEHEFGFYNLDLSAAQYYLCLHKLFPLCQLKAELDGDQIIEIEATNSPWDLQHELPPLRLMQMHGENTLPLGPKSRIHLSSQGEQQTIYLADGRQAVTEFNDFISRHDPDIILSERGDARLLPALLKVADRERLPLKLDRDQVVTKRRIETEGRTYFSYGRVIYKGPSYPFFGRWHIDYRNSFTYHEAGLEGLLELARLSKVPVQRMARTSPGSAMSAMQIDRAVSDGILIPWRKSEPESYKTALELLTVDKGGLTYQPRIGAYEDIAEIDFASMYPTIMVRHNVSPETVLCKCCENQVVPEAGYNICEKREGLIPRTLEPLLVRRKLLKEIKRLSEDDKERAIADARQSAIKWMLVSCFGYLGYKNARFGRIEAHEAVTAFGRDKLLKAKELAEARGYRMLHALTDSLWLKGPDEQPLDEAELKALCDEITAETDVEMSLEGIYRWIEFLPSKANHNRPVAVRYFGVFTEGVIKLRGLACRHSDTPEFIRQAQLKLLEIIAQAKNLAERDELERVALAEFEQQMKEIAAGRLEPKQLVVSQTLSREPEGYRVETRAATAARLLNNAGINVHPGERVQYLIADLTAKDKAKRISIGGDDETVSYDIEEYQRLLKAAG
ncbi:MAG TPA: DNA polymerase domain-containing protein, partial [Blastocatellia bacterium]|nr:DNA polymerase domain-containing protein [Blastocatellia bacterium]